MSEVTTSERLLPAECWRLVGDRAFGRLAYVDGPRVQITPAHVHLAGHTAYVRATTFGSLARLAHQVHPASLEVEEVDDAGTSGWSVQLSGHCHRVQEAATLAWLWSPDRVHPWTPGPETCWVALVVDAVEGRRVST